MKRGREPQVTPNGSQRGSRSLGGAIVMIVINRAHAHGRSQPVRISHTCDSVQPRAMSGIFFLSWPLTLQETV